MGRGCSRSKGGGLKSWRAKRRCWGVWGLRREEESWGHGGQRSGEEREGTGGLGSEVGGGSWSLGVRGLGAWQGQLLQHTDRQAAGTTGCCPSGRRRDRAPTSKCQTQTLAALFNTCHAGPDQGWVRSMESAPSPEDSEQGKVGVGGLEWGLYPPPPQASCQRPEALSCHRESMSPSPPPPVPLTPQSLL